MTRTPQRGFADIEFEARTAGAQALMAEQGLAGLLLLSEPDVRYFSGFHTLFWQSPTRPWFLFVPPEGKPIAIIPEIGADLMRRTWLDDIRTWSAPAPWDDGISLLTELLSPLAAQQSGYELKAFIHRFTLSPGHLRASSNAPMCKRCLRYSL